MKIYHYHPISGVLLSIGEAGPDPLQPENWLVPDFATDLAPQTITDYHVPVYLDGIWLLLEDHRDKTVYHKQTLVKRKITEFGPLPDIETELSPGPDDIWDEETARWQLDPAALNRHKSNRITAINQWRNQQEAENLVFTHAGRTWDGGIASKSRMDETLALTKVIGVVPEGFFWTSADDVDIPITLLELESLAEALYAARGLRGFEIHARQRQMKAEVSALTTIEEVQAYPVGWPTEVPA